MRLVAALALVFGMAQTANAQTVTCKIFGNHGIGSYGMMQGMCKKTGDDPPPQAGADAQRVRYWPEGDVQVVITGGEPGDKGPWRGYFLQPDYADVFELTRERAGSREQLVLRTGVGWTIVDTWSRVASNESTMTFRLTSMPASEADLDILNDTLKKLSSPSAWDRADDRDCGNDSPGRVSLFCALQNAAIARIGRFHGAQPALDLVRLFVLERWTDRVNHGHALTNFNNHPDTTLEDVRWVLQEAARRAREEIVRAK